jgi:hypothetical protein
MAANHRFRTYTQLEKAYCRILARRMPTRRRQKLQTRYRQNLKAVDVNAWIVKRQSDSITALRHMTIEGRANTRPLGHHSHTLERIIA